MMCVCSFAGTSACASCFYNPSGTRQANNFMTWGNREEPTCHLVEDDGLLHCSNCGGVAEKRLWAYWHYCPNCGAKVVGE